MNFAKKCLYDIKKGYAYFALNDGYNGWSYGDPTGAIVLTFDEYVLFCNKLKQKYKFDFVKEFLKRGGFDYIFPTDIGKFFGKKICGIYSPYIADGHIPTKQEFEKYFFKTDAEKQASEKAKEELMKKLREAEF